MPIFGARSGLSVALTTFRPQVAGRLRQPFLTSACAPPRSEASAPTKSAPLTERSTHRHLFMHALRTQSLAFLRLALHRATRGPRPLMTAGGVFPARRRRRGSGTGPAGRRLRDRWSPGCWSAAGETSVAGRRKPRGCHGGWIGRPVVVRGRCPERAPEPPSIRNGVPGPLPPTHRVAGCEALKVDQPCAPCHWVTCQSDLLRALARRE